MCCMFISRRLPVLLGAWVYLMRNSWINVSPTWGLRVVEGLNPLVQNGHRSPWSMGCSRQLHFYWRPSGEGNTAALLFLIGTAISGRRNKACNSQSAIPARGHGFNVFNVFNGSKDIMATCIRHMLQAAVALHICAICLPRAGSILKQNHDESIAKISKFHSKCMR